MRNYNQDHGCASAAKALSEKVQQTLVDMSALQAQSELCRQLSLKIDALTKDNRSRFRPTSVAPTMVTASCRDASSPDMSAE
jgi:hypothetical protein